MPGMDGGEVLAQLRRDPRTNTVPIVAVTGVPEWLDEHPELVKQFDGVLVKPVTSETLMHEIRWLVA